MRAVEIQMSIPAVALALILAAALSPGLSTVVIVIVLTYWTWYARIVCGEVLSLRRRDYVLLATVAGVGTATVFRRHLLPNIGNTLLVLASLQVGQVILFEASLSFLGLGIQQPDVSWGLMLSDARQYISKRVLDHHPAGPGHHADVPRGEPVRRLVARPARPALAPAVTPLLEVQGLQTHLHVRRGVLRAVDGVDLRIEEGQTLGLVGESGSGKTMTGPVAAAACCRARPAASPAAA